MPVPGVPLLNGMFVEARIMAYDVETFQLGLMVFRGRVSEVIGLEATDVTAVRKLDDTMAPLMKAILCEDVIYYGCSLRILGFNPGPVDRITALNTGPGVRVGVTSPGQLSALISLSTAYSGPAGRGRKYIPFIPLLAITIDNKLDPGYVAAVEAIAARFTADLLVGVIGQSCTIKWGLMAPDPILFKPFEGWAVSSFIATQRRRGSYGKMNLIPISNS